MIIASGTAGLGQSGFFDTAALVAGILVLFWLRFKWWTTRLTMPLDEVFEPGTMTFRVGVSAARLEGRFKGRRVGLVIRVWQRYQMRPKQTIFAAPCRTDLEFSGRARMDRVDSRQMQWCWDLVWMGDDRLIGLCDRTDLESRLIRMSEVFAGRVLLENGDLSYIREAIFIWRLPVDKVRRLFTEMVGVAELLERSERGAEVGD